ncbi:MAG: c-type cytochrome domain-containing protein [Phycisphaerales bacterium]
MLANLIELLARTHLVVLHFPIALITIAAITESLRLAHRSFFAQAQSDPFTPSSGAAIMVAFALASTIVAVTTGLLLGFNEGSEVDLHRIFAIITGVLVLAASIALIIALRKSSSRATIAYLALLLLCAASVTVTGHLGGSLTHGDGFLTDPLKAIINPPPKQPPAPPIDIQALNISQAAADTYTETIAPILEYSCIKCHGHKKQKGDIRLDTIAYLLDEDFDIIERGNPEDSEIIYRVELPEEDEDAMPPLRKSHPLTDSQIESLRAWIESLAR